ncbi:hypothetical protein HF325_002800 [Metschnikowia pulcherrima]|uniref:Altered inheritance of mitochondria protein 24, mitochondrial n=1 Tax=Metschnikowia pulcherrima TaxID=27326 RepID=A0A8H7LDF8_9ASCO|nr:hypothetical protein HF325_002800 [Metschnikowia pulcherrima]
MRSCMLLPRLTLRVPFAARTRRSLSFQQAPQALGAIPVKFAPVDEKLVENVAKLPGSASHEDVQLEALGTPALALSVSAPPSFPVFIRRNTMLALQAGANSVNVTPRLVNPLVRFAHGNFVSRYQEYVATAPFQMLVSLYAPTWFPRLFRRVTQKSFTSVSMDGRVDWALLKRDALHVYAGPSLEVSMRFLPRHISRRFSKHLKLAKRAPTGLFKWYKLGYTFVHGRGVLGLVGNGTVYSADIPEGEFMAINRAHLLGVSVNGPHDLENCVLGMQNTAVVDNAVVVPPPRVAQIKTWRDFLIQLKYYYWKLFDLYRQIRGRSSQYAVTTTDFVKVMGPRTVLLQSGAPHESFERKFNLPRLTPASHVEMMPVKPVEKVPADYLNIVTIDPEKGPTIESTNDFKDGLRGKQ